VSEVVRSAIKEISVHVHNVRRKIAKPSLCIYIWVVENSLKNQCILSGIQ